MDDHFWPAMYPGIIAGFLLGLGGGNVVSTILGTVGGLVGAVALYFVFTWLGLEDSILSLVETHRRGRGWGLSDDERPEPGWTSERLERLKSGSR